MQELAEQARIADPDSEQVAAFLKIAERQLGSEHTAANHSRSIPDENDAPPSAAVEAGTAAAAETPARAVVGKRLRSVREAMGMTQTAVAVAAGITQAAVSNYERGKRELPLSTLINLSAVLDLDLKQLLDLPEINRYIERELSDMGTARFDARSKRLEWSDGMYRVLGLEPGSVEPSPKTVLQLVHPQDRAGGRAWFEELLSGEPSGPSQFRVVLPGGEVRHIEGYGRVQVDSKGAVVGFVATLHDITQRQVAEEELTESHEHLARAQDVAKLASWEMDVETGQVRGSGRVPGLLDESGGTPQVLDRLAYLEMVHPDDRDRVWEALERARTEGTPVRHEYRFIHPDGSVHVMRARSQVVRDESGRPIRVIGTTQDVTELAVARDSVEASASALAWLSEQLHLASFRFDHEGRIIGLNAAFAALTGRTEIELIGHPVADLLAPEGRDSIDVFEAGIFEETVSLNTTRGGSVPVRLATLPIVSDDEERDGSIGVVIPAS